MKKLCVGEYVCECVRVMCVYIVKRRQIGEVDEFVNSIDFSFCLFKTVYFFKYTIGLCLLKHNIDKFLKYKDILKLNHIIMLRRNLISVKNYITEIR